MLASHILASRARTAPISTLLLLFVTWKLLLFVLVATSPGIGYDTSTSLLLSQHDSSTFQHEYNRQHTSHSLSPVAKLARWDAIYFAPISQRGYLYEQEWAFGLGHTRHLGAMSNSVKTLFHLSEPPTLVVGVALSHVYHLLSVIALYLYSKTLFVPNNSNSQALSIPFVAAAAHIISPGGLFLSAPYAESLTSFLTFSGYYLYTQGALLHSEGHLASGSLLTIFSGVTFGLATSVRSNGLFNGLLFLCDSLRLYRHGLRNVSSLGLLSRQLALNCGGACIALGFLIPQCLGFLTYCGTGPDQRPWCNNFIPSIYSWVQSHYWNVGFLRYWTLSNLPLFFLAAPTLTIMIFTAWDMAKGNVTVGEGHQQETTRRSVDERRRILRLSALPQLLLAFTTLTNAHVQIVTRLASAASCWYQWLAARLLRRTVVVTDDRGRLIEIIVRWMVIYAFVQGGLFASFLPPA